MEKNPMGAASMSRWTIGAYLLGFISKNYRENNNSGLKCLMVRKVARNVTIKLLY